MSFGSSEYQEVTKIYKEFMDRAAAAEMAARQASQQYIPAVDTSRDEELRERCLGRSLSAAMHCEDFKDTTARAQAYFNFIKGK